MTTNTFGALTLPAGGVSTVTFTNGSPSIGWTSNTLLAGQVVQFTTTGTLPTPFATGTNYYVLATGLSGSMFEVATSNGGTAITATSAGSGTQTGSAFAGNATIGGTLAVTGATTLNGATTLAGATSIEPQTSTGQTGIIATTGLLVNQPILSGTNAPAGNGYAQNEFRVAADRMTITNGQSANLLVTDYVFGGGNVLLQTSAPTGTGSDVLNFTTTVGAATFNGTTTTNPGPPEVTTLTVNSVASGTVLPYMELTVSGTPIGYVQPYGTGGTSGTGGTGTYILIQPTPVATGPTTMTGNSTVPTTGIIYDETNPTAIPTQGSTHGTFIASSTGTTVTMTNNAAGSGVQTGDLIAFYPMVGARNGMNVFCSQGGLEGTFASTANGFSSVCSGGQAGYSYNMGGTSPTNLLGAVWSQAWVTTLSPGATFIGEADTTELDLNTAAGSSYGTKSILKGVFATDGLAQAHGFLNYDIGYSLASGGSTNAYGDYGFLFGRQNSAWPFAYSAALANGGQGSTILSAHLGTDYLTNGAPALGGIDFSQPNFASDVNGGFFARSLGITITSTGTIRQGPGALTPSTSGITLDTGNSVETGAVTVVSGGNVGALCKTGDKLFGRDGIYEVTGPTTPGLVTAAAPYTDPFGQTHYATAPGLSVAQSTSLPVDADVVAQARGCSGVVLGVTWSSPGTLGLGSVNASQINIGNNSSATQVAGTFQVGNSDLLLLGSSTGYTTFTSANSSPINYTMTVPAAATTDTLATLAATQTFSGVLTLSSFGNSNHQALVLMNAGLSANGAIASAGTNLIQAGEVTGTNNVIRLTPAGGGSMAYITTIGPSGQGQPLTIAPQTRTTSAPYGTLTLTADSVIFGAAQWTANGTTATTMTSLGPAGAHTTVQEWFTVTDASGNVRYIPAY